MRPVACLAAAAVALALVLATGADSARAAGDGARLDPIERAIVRGINRRRARHGLGALREVRRLARAADFHSREMLAGDYFAHASRDGSSFATRIRRYVRASTLGETLAMLWPPRREHMARCVVSMWMHSPPHRAILLSRSFHRLGVARRTGSLGGRRACVVTADFAG